MLNNYFHHLQMKFSFGRPLLGKGGKVQNGCKLRWWYAINSLLNIFIFLDDEDFIAETSSARTSKTAETVRKPSLSKKKVVISDDEDDDYENQNVHEDDDVDDEEDEIDVVIDDSLSEDDVVAKKRKGTATGTKAKGKKSSPKKPKTAVPKAAAKKTLPLINTSKTPLSVKKPLNSLATPTRPSSSYSLILITDFIIVVKSASTPSPSNLLPRNPPLRLGLSKRSPVRESLHPYLQK